ncbi:MAG: hypothetical protein GF329_00645 [Candidatus Lokiarchaeota archaeon]|nr:hypothetical protein [Candidatus Lokiarchaeota archaeon]
MIKISIAERILLRITVMLLNSMIEKGKPPNEIFLSCKMAFCSAYKLLDSIEGQQALVKINYITLLLAEGFFNAKDFHLALQASIMGKRFAECIKDVKSLNSFLTIINKIIKSDLKLKDYAKKLELIDYDWIRKFCS